ncbi:SBBP repeat-containing protein [Chamaesiphon polymorphus]
MRTTIRSIAIDGRGNSYIAAIIDF